MNKEKCICFVLMLAIVVLCGILLRYSRFATKSELRKYYISIKQAVDFYRDSSEDVGILSNVLHDAWGTPFEISVNPIGERVVFVSKGSNPNTSDDDLVIEISKRSYYHKFRYGKYVSEVSEFYD